MPNNHHLQYKPDMTLGHKIYIGLEAGDWIALMTWFNTVENIDGITGIVMGPGGISSQLVMAMYAPASVKAATAQHSEQEGQHPLNQIIQQMTGQSPFTPEQFTEGNEE